MPRTHQVSRQAIDLVGHVLKLGTEVLVLLDQAVTLLAQSRGNGPDELVPLHV